jgi:pSer/pThr/pTyr-binding forkhead associated (FHA) protein
MASLALYDTDFIQLQGNGPNIIKLDKKKFIMGRGSPNYLADIVISAKKVNQFIISRHHANIELIENNDKVFDSLSTITLNNINYNYILHDMNALNGVFVNGIRIKKRLLINNDIIQLGGGGSCPFGKSLETNDLCVKYKFLINTNNLKIETKKRKNNEVVYNNINNELKFENVKIKKEFDLQKDIIEDLNRKLSSLNNKLNEINQNNLLLEKNLEYNQEIISDLKVKISSLEQQTKNLNEANNNNSSNNNLRNINSATPSNNNINNINNNICITIDPSIIKAELECNICNKPMLDASILKCSHGYCRNCIESHLRKNKSTCVKCNNKPSKPISNIPSQMFANAYTRSDQLNNLYFIYMNVMNLDDSDRKFKAEKILNTYGIFNNDDEYLSINNNSNEITENEKKLSISNKINNDINCSFCSDTGHSFEDCPFTDSILKNNYNCSDQEY